MNRLLLYLIMLPAGLWRRMGADPLQLHAILDVKLKMDNRRPRGMGQRPTQRVGSGPAEYKPGFFVRLRNRLASAITGRPVVQKQRKPAAAKGRRFSTAIGMFVSFATGIIYVMPLVMMNNELSGLW